MPTSSSTGPVTGATGPAESRRRSRSLAVRSQLHSSPARPRRRGPMAVSSACSSFQTEKWRDTTLSNKESACLSDDQRRILADSSHFVPLYCLDDGSSARWYPKLRQVEVSWRNGHRKSWYSSTKTKPWRFAHTTVALLQFILKGIHPVLCSSFAYLTGLNLVERVQHQHKLWCQICTCQSIDFMIHFQLLHIK